MKAEPPSIGISTEQASRAMQAMAGVWPICRYCRRPYHALCETCPTCGAPTPPARLMAHPGEIRLGRYLG